MRKKKFAILGNLFCMAVICLLSPRLWGAGCGTSATTEEILSEFDPAIRLGFDDFSYPFTFSFSTAEPVELRTMVFNLSSCDLPETFMYPDLGAKATGDTTIDSVVDHLQPYRLGGVSATERGTKKTLVNKKIVGEGETRYEYSDGSEIIVYPDGRWRETNRKGKIQTIEYYPTGCQVWYLTNGEIEFRGAGSSSFTVREADEPGTSTSTRSKGKNITTYPNGTSFQTFDDGRMMFVTNGGTEFLLRGKQDPATGKEPSGTPTTTTEPDGSTMTFSGDGGWVRSYPGGAEIRAFPGGSQILFTPQGRVILLIRSDGGKRVTMKETPEGNLYIYPDGATILAKPNGSRLLINFYGTEYEERTVIQEPLVDSVVDHLQPFVLGGPTSETIEANKAWEKAWEKAKGKRKEAYDKAQKAREAEAKAKAAAKKLGQALNDAMDAEPGSDQAKEAAENVSDAAKEAKKTAKEAKNAKEEAEKASKESNKAADDANEAAKKANEAREKR